MVNIIFSSPWYWLIAGILLIAAEAITPGILFLWFGAGAIAVGLFIALWPEAPLSVQLIIFVVCMLGSILLGIRYQQKSKSMQPGNDINNGLYAFKGRRGVATEPFTREGRIYIGDSFYDAFSLYQIDKNQSVIVSDVKENILIVEPIKEGEFSSGEPMW